MTDWGKHSPNETHRILSGLERQSAHNDRTILGWDIENVIRGITYGTGNARYIIVQANDYLETLEQAALTEDGLKDKAYMAHARSEMGRVLALCVRECLRHQWDLLDVLTEGVEYETEVVATRTAESAKYFKR